MASLPRPSRPSLNVSSAAPAAGIPVSKIRPSTGASPAGTPAGPSPPATSPAAGLSSTSLPKPPSRSPSSSSIATNAPTANGTYPAPPQTLATPGKQLRKTASYNVFPKATTPGVRLPNGGAGPSPATTPRTSKRASSLYNATPSRTQSLSAPPPRVPNANGATAMNAKSVPTTPVLDSGSPITETINEAGEPRGRPQSTTSKDKGNVVISVRVRPEGPQNDQSAAAAAAAGEWMVDGRQALVSYRGREGGDYVYDNVFTAHDKNAKVYDSGAKRLVRRVMEGYHGTVFAYGMTGTGKTYSMQGTATSPGVIPLAITDIFSFIRETPQREFLLRVSYLEIYNEKIHDLLTPPAQGAGPGPPQEVEIKLREDGKRGVYATPLKEEIVQSPTQLLRVIARGDQARRTSSTQFNARSSRSHAVVQIVVESRERSSGAAPKPDSKRSGLVPGGVRVSTLSLIDLAGSERAAENKERRTEGAHINKSLLTLGTVVSKLSGAKDKSGQPMDKDGKHLPYRDSKLTRLLQPALSGDSLISILCTIQIGSSNSVAAAGTHTIETLNTLKFAARARNNIVSHAKKAEESHANIGDANSRALLDRYRFEILDLRKQLESQKQEGEKAKDEEEEKQRQAEDEARHEEQMLEMQLARTALKERIDHLNRLILSSKSIGVNNASISGMSQRGSAFGASKSVRSSSGSVFGSMHDLSRKTSTTSMNTATIKGASEENKPQTPQESPPPEDMEEEDTAGELGDGTASQATQIKNLQADLADKTRYITTLEKRLLQARRNSRSRVSATFAGQAGQTIPENEAKEDFDSVVRDKDAEIADLRARLDDKDRMIAALKSAARKRDAADSRPSSVSPSVFAGERGSPRTSAVSIDTIANGNHRRTSNGSPMSPGHNHVTRSGSVTTPPSSLSKMASATSENAVEHSPSPERKKMGAASGNTLRPVKRNHGVDEMTRMLDDMIKQKVEAGGAINKPLPRRPNSQQIPSNSPIAQAIAATGEQRAASAADLRKSNESELKVSSARPISPPVAQVSRAMSPLNGRPANINTNTSSPPQSPPGSSHRARGRPSIDSNGLAGWQDGVRRKSSLKKSSQEGNTLASPSGSRDLGSPINWTSKHSPAHSNGIYSPSTTLQSSPTVPSRSPIDERPLITTENAPPLPSHRHTPSDGLYSHNYSTSGSTKSTEMFTRTGRDMLKPERLSAPDRDVSPASDSTAILDEVQESARGEGGVGLGIEAR